MPSWKAMRSRSDEGDAQKVRIRFALLKTLGYDTEGEGLGSRQSFSRGSAVGEHAGQFHNVG